MKRSRLRSVGRRKRRLQRRGLADGPLCAMVRGHRCCVPDCERPGVPHHVDHAGLRMDWLVDRSAEGFPLRLTGNVAPLCHHHHTELHDRLGRPVFEWEYDLNLSDVARWWGDAFQRAHPATYRRILEAA